MVLLIAVACGGDDATPVVIEKEVIVEKEVIKEVQVTVMAMEPTPTPVVKAVPQAVVPAYVSKGKYGGVVPLAGTWDPGFLDLHFSASLNSGLLVAAPRFNQLVEFNPVDPNEIIGDLSVGWDVSNDGKTYTFFLHPKANWADGKPVTAEDIVFSMDRITDPDAVRPRAGAAIKPFYANGTARAIDEKTVEIPLKFASAAFLPWLAFDYIKMYPKHIAENLTQEEVNCCYENMLGSGPWLFKDLKRGPSWSGRRIPTTSRRGGPSGTATYPTSSRTTAGRSRRCRLGRCWQICSPTLVTLTWTCSSSWRRTPTASWWRCS